MFIVTALWLIDWVLSFEWLNTLTSPIQKLADSLQGVVGTFGAAGAFMAIAALVGGVYMLRGKFASGIYEILTTCLVATLATGMFANPVAQVGGQDGFLMKARDLGLGVAAGMSIDGPAAKTDDSPEDVRKRVNGELATTFIRIPSQIVNYGKIVETGKCAPLYEAATAKKDGTYGLQSGDAYKMFEYCDKTAKNKADNPSVDMIISAFFLAVAGFAVLLFALVLLAAIMFAAVFALYSAIKAIITLVVALLPGNSRGSLAMTFAELLTSMALVVFSIVFLMSYLMVVNALFADAGDSTGSVIKSFMFIDIMLFVGIGIFWKGRTALRKSSARLSQAFMKRPGGGGPSRSPAHASGGSGGRALARLGSQAAMYRKMGMAGAATAGGGLGAKLGTAVAGGAAFPVALAYLAGKGVKSASQRARARSSAHGAGNPAGGGSSSSTAQPQSVVGRVVPRGHTPGGGQGAAARAARLQRARARTALVAGTPSGKVPAKVAQPTTNPRRPDINRQRGLPSTPGPTKPLGPGPSRPKPTGPARPTGSLAPKRTDFDRIRVNGQTIYSPKNKG